MPEFLLKNGVKTSNNIPAVRMILRRGFRVTIFTRFAQKPESAFLFLFLPN